MLILDQLEGVCKKELTGEVANIASCRLPSLDKENRVKVVDSSMVKN